MQTKLDFYFSAQTMIVTSMENILCRSSTKSNRFLDISLVKDGVQQFHPHGVGLVLEILIKCKFSLKSAQLNVESTSSS